jgi:predicted acylesterase/phospholipase RssA
MLLAKRDDGAIVPFESAGVLYRDGSMQNDIPLRELASQFHATHFIVSQVRLGLRLGLRVRVRVGLPRHALHRLAGPPAHAPCTLNPVTRT